jgi:hypothetical protein
MEGNKKKKKSGIEGGGPGKTNGSVLVVWKKLESGEQDNHSSIL